MKSELWYSEHERSGALLGEADSSLARVDWPDARMIWSVETDEYALAQEICGDVLRWCSQEPSGAQATIRLTMAFCLDSRGEKCNFTVPGWVGRFPKPVPGSEDMYVALLDYLYWAAPNRGQILGYGYIERPGRITLEGATLVVRGTRPEVLTVVMLRSADGTEEMAQEFHEPFRDYDELARRVGERLGAELSNWRIISAESIWGFAEVAPPN